MGGKLMKTGLYYFSSTGNCLTTTRILKEALGDCDLIPLAALKNLAKIKVEYQRVGFIIPIYYGDMPFLVRQVISKMEFDESVYIFLMATYRGHPGDIAKRLDDLLHQQNASLALDLGISMPGNSYLSTKEQIKETLTNQKANILKQIPLITDQVRKDYSHNETPKPSKVGLKAYNMRGIKADENCVGCGICVKVCPMNNIKIENGHAVIGDNCITCLACFHWCRQEAIYMSKEKDIERREKYHHPDVTLIDIINQKGDCK